MTTEIEQLQNENVADFMRNGPGLRFSYNQWIVARDRVHGWSLVGGLGAVGVGEMWGDDALWGYHAQLPGYDDAPEMSAVGGFGAFSLSPESETK